MTVIVTQDNHIYNYSILHTTHVGDVDDVKFVSATRYGHVYIYINTKDELRIVCIYRDTKTFLPDAQNAIGLSLKRGTVVVFYNDKLSLFSTNLEHTHTLEFVIHPLDEFHISDNGITILTKHNYYIREKTITQGQIPDKYKYVVMYLGAESKFLCIDDNNVCEIWNPIDSLVLPIEYDIIKCNGFIILNGSPSSCGFIILSRRYFYIDYAEIQKVLNMKIANVTYDTLILTDEESFYYIDNGSVIKIPDQYKPYMKSTPTKSARNIRCL